MRLDIDTYKEIVDSITRNKTRSILTGFGVFWGIFMLLFLAGGGNGFKTILQHNFEGFANNVSVTIAERTTRPYKGYQQGRYWNMTFADIDALKSQLYGVKVITPLNSVFSRDMSYEDKTYNGTIKGMKADYNQIETPEIKYGRFLSEMDILQERKVCVIGLNVYNTLFPEGGDPCGKKIKVGNTYYTIIGLDSRSVSISINDMMQNSIVIPINLLNKIYRHNSQDFDILCFRAEDDVKTADVEAQIRQYFSRKYNFDPEDSQAMIVLNLEEMFNLVDNLMKGLNFLILLIGLGTILAGAIGVSNIMMVSVKERTIEIGIRRAIGATPKDILSQIILEGTALTSIAGLSGIVITVMILAGLEKGVSASQGFFVPFQVSFWPAVAAAVGVIVIGILAALAPASRAMRIKPVDAMRDE